MRDLVHGAYNSNDTVLRHPNDRIAIRFKPDYDFTMHRFGLLQRLDGTTYVGGSTNGYANGTGGTALMRAVLMNPSNGLPDYTQELGREQVAIQTVWSRSRSVAYPNATNTGAFMFYQFSGLPMIAGRHVWFVLSNVTADPATDWFCMNGPNGPLGGVSGDLGYQELNYPFDGEPATKRALYGMDPTEAIAWSVTGDDGPWHFGRLGGLHGQTRPPKPTNRNGPGTGYYEKKVTPFFAWTEAPGNVKFKRNCGENAYGSGATTIGNIEVIAKSAAPITHVNAICAASPGTVTCLNVTTGQSASADLSTGFTTIPAGREKALATPVAVNVGDRIRLSSTGPVRTVQPDSSTVPYMETTYRTSSGSVTTPQLGCRPWPGFPAQVAPPPPPPPPPADTTGPSVSLDLAEGQVILVPMEFTATVADPSGVHRVEFYIDGVKNGVDQLFAPYTTDPLVTPANYTPGTTHTLEARAFDIFGNSTSVSRQFVAGIAPPPPPPTDCSGVAAERDAALAALALSEAALATSESTLATTEALLDNANAKISAAIVTGTELVADLEA